MGKMLLKITDVIYKCSFKARVFVPGRTSHSSLKGATTFSITTLSMMSLFATLSKNVTQHK